MALFLHRAFRCVEHIDGTTVVTEVVVVVTTLRNVDDVKHLRGGNRNDVTAPDNDNVDVDDDGANVYDSTKTVYCDSNINTSIVNSRCRGIGTNDTILSLILAARWWSVKASNKYYILIMLLPQQLAEAFTTGSTASHISHVTPSSRSGPKVRHRNLLRLSVCRIMSKHLEWMWIFNNKHITSLSLSGLLFIQE
jgi:hypothetical protein